MFLSGDSKRVARRFPVAAVQKKVGPLFFWMAFERNRNVRHTVDSSPNTASREQEGPVSYHGLWVISLPCIAQRKQPSFCL